MGYHCWLLRKQTVELGVARVVIEGATGALHFQSVLCVLALSELLEDADGRLPIFHQVLNTYYNSIFLLFYYLQRGFLVTFNH